MMLRYEVYSLRRFIKLRIRFAVLDKLYGKVGTNKSYISRIEKGALEPGVGLFFRIIDALGLKVEIVKPMI